jgi:TonB family protein
MWWRDMKKALQICILLLVLAPMAFPQSETQPFFLLEKQVKAQRGWMLSKENLSDKFNAERIRLEGNFEAELFKYLGTDIEKHYWIAWFLVEPDYLHGNKPMPYVALLIQQQALSLLRGKTDEESLGNMVQLSVSAAVLSKELGLASLAATYKQEAERLSSKNADLKAWYPAMSEYKHCLYDSIGRDGGKNSRPSPCKKVETSGEKKPHVIRVALGVLEKKALSKPPAIYPEEARSKGISGEVMVEILIDQSGNVESARALSGPPQLQEAALKAARQARFPVTKLGGEPAKVVGALIYSFLAQK